MDLDDPEYDEMLKIGEDNVKSYAKDEVSKSRLKSSSRVNHSVPLEKQNYKTRIGHENNFSKSFKKRFMI